MPDLSEPLSFFLYYGINGGQNNAVDSQFYLCLRVGRTKRFLSELSFQSLATCVVPCGIGSEKIRGLGPGLSPLSKGTEITFNIFVDQSDLANCCLDGNLRFDLQMDNGLRFPVLSFFMASTEARTMQWSGS